MLNTFRTGRRVALTAGVLVGASALTVSLAVPASAVTISDWVTGHVPSGSSCSVADVSVSGSDLHVAFTDGTTPTVSGWSINGKTTNQVLVPGLNPVTFGARVKQSCGGVGSGVAIFIKYNALGFGNSFSAVGASTPTSTSPFDQTFTNPFSGAAVAYAGWYQVPAVQVSKRYDSFVLNSTDYSSVSSVANTAAATTVTGPWSTQRIYLLLKTTVSTSASKSTVAAGGSVTFRAVLKKAGATTYDPAVGSIVLFQTKTGTGSWVTRATKTASSTGAVAYTFKPSKTMSWRWVHKGEKTSTFTAPVTSTVKKITVT